VFERNGQKNKLTLDRNCNGWLANTQVGYEALSFCSILSDLVCEISERVKKQSRPITDFFQENDV
jgi:hypothetical protein